MTRYAYLFPGQGSQFAGMGRELAETFVESRTVFESADSALELDLSGLCFEGPEERLRLTENTQPAILTTSVAALAALRGHGLRPCAAAGHSLGEYSAHVAAGTLPFESALRAVRLRGRYMQEAVPPGRGAMAAVLGLDRERVAAVCAAVGDGEILAAANLNGPAQVVIAGDAAAVDRAGPRLREAGAKRVVPLAVSAPFHCELMRPAAERLAPVLEAIDFEDPDFPVFSNVDAVPVTDGAAAREALLRQVASAVRWEESIRAMIESGVETFVEVGPGKVLAGLVRGIERSVRVIPAGDPDGVRRAVEELA